MATGMISTEGMSSMITNPIVMIDIECQPLPRGVGHMCLSSTMTDALTVSDEEFQSTPENRVLSRGKVSLERIEWEDGGNLMRLLNRHFN